MLCRRQSLAPQAVLTAPGKRSGAAACAAPALQHKIKAAQTQSGVWEQCQSGSQGSACAAPALQHQSAAVQTQQASSVRNSAGQALKAAAYATAHKARHCKQSAGVKFEKQCQSGNQGSCMRAPALRHTKQGSANTQQAQCRPGSHSSCMRAPALRHTKQGRAKA
jgi:hypothetical protein